MLLDLATVLGICGVVIILLAPAARFVGYERGNSINRRQFILVCAVAQLGLIVGYVAALISGLMDWATLTIGLLIISALNWLQYASYLIQMRFLAWFVKKIK